MAKKSSRREFLQGRPAAESLAEAIHAAMPPATPGASSPQPPSGTYLIHVSRQAMACQFEALFNAGGHSDVTTAGVQALELVGALEAQLSYFRQESDISRINRAAALEPVEVEPRLFDLLRLAMTLHRQTGGAYDITATPLWEIWGFARRKGTLPDDEAIAHAKELVGGDLVDLDPDRSTIRFRRPGVKLNLGSLGKGYALDCAAEVLEAAGIGDFLLHAGQSSILARGTRLEAGPETAGESRPGWTVGIPHPLRPDRRWAEVRLHHRALGTSGGAFQSFRHGGKRYVHILDPRTGRPAEGTIAVTVLAPTAALADALSTAFFVMGPEPARQYCTEHPEIAAIIFCERRGKAGFEAHAVGFAEDELRVAPTRVPPEEVQFG
ncbi:MAG: FAD:protein FMN transferase [Thermoguttaceae bacterium]|jgi:thiamine biosynthesis lipoprotein|nr:FAD:protein FMN transferase [Thermoguttaceae bacterium]